MRSSALLILSLLAATASQASNLSFLQGTAIARFNAEDMDLMLKNADEALTADGLNAKREWNNPKTGSSGFAEVRSKFTSTEGRDCKRLRVGNRATAAQPKEATYTLCKHDESWMLDSNAKPAATEKPQG